LLARVFDFVVGNHGKRILNGEGPLKMDKKDSEEGKIPALPDLFTWSEDGVRIRSAKCNSCGTYFFPEYHAQHRPGCSREGVEKVLLSRVGKLASYTVQYYLPPPPFKTQDDITPYTIGLVEFPEGIQVCGIVVESEPDKLKVGTKVETTTYTLYKNDEGQDVVTWAFRVLNK
jgi:uncharacterized OB-fold protein